MSAENATPAGDERAKLARAQQDLARARAELAEVEAELLQLQRRLEQSADARAELEQAMRLVRKAGRK